MVQCNLLIVEPHMADMWLERISPQLLAVLQTPSHSKTHSINTVYSMDANKNECPEKLHSINADVHHNTYAFVDYEVGNTNRHTRPMPLVGNWWWCKVVVPGNFATGLVNFMTTCNEEWPLRGHLTWSHHRMVEAKCTIVIPTTVQDP